MKILELVLKILEKFSKEDSYMKKVEEYWNNKRPKVNVLYKARTAPYPFNDVKLEVDVRNFVQPNDCLIKKWLESKGLKVKDDSKCDDVVYQIYKEHNKNLKYKHDDVMYKTVEFWAFPFEYMQLSRVGDCDDAANSLGSTLIAAGVPRFRVRIVAGLTRSGYGHLTVYYLADDLKTWKHLNSTTPARYIKPFKDLPDSKDKNDSIGIEHVWFSYNDKYAWHSFDTNVSKLTFPKDVYKINP